MRIGVRFAPQQLRVVALSAQRARKLRGNQPRALIVVRNDLRLRDARRIDLAIDQEHGNASLRRPAHGGDRCIGPRIVQNQHRRIRGDRSIDQVVLPVGIVIVRIHAHAIAQRQRARCRRVGFGFEKWIVLQKEQ